MSRKKKMVTLCVECSAVAQNQLVSLITSRCPCLADKLWCCNMIVKHCFLKWVFYILSHPLLSVFLWCGKHISLPQCELTATCLREYSNTPYLAGSVGLLIFWYWCVFSKLYGFFSPCFYLFALKKKAFYTLQNLKKCWKLCRPHGTM